MPAWSITVVPDRPLALPDALGLAARLGPTSVLTMGGRGTTTVDAELDAEDAGRAVARARRLCGGQQVLAVLARPA